MFADATVYVTPSQTTQGELWTGGETITHVGPAHGPRPEHARVIDAGGASIVPLIVDNAQRARPAHERSVRDLAAGNPATFAVTRGRVTASQIIGTLTIRPDDLIAIVVSGRMMGWRGIPANPAGPESGSLVWPGAWIDDDHALEQHLLPDGRYTETRHGRVDAYTGRYWTRGPHIVYLDDTGFWAFGEQLDTVLYHAEFIMTRHPTR